MLISQDLEKVNTTWDTNLYRLWCSTGARGFGAYLCVKITFHGLDWEDRLGSIHAVLRGSKNLNRKVSALLAQEPVLTEQVCQERTELSEQP